MYACLHSAKPAGGDELLKLVFTFSPHVEETSEETFVFSIAPLRKLIGSPHQIASEICHAGYTQKLQANLAIASNPDAAILLARNYPGVTLVTPGEEHLKLAPLPLTALLTHTPGADHAVLEVLHRWGLKTFGELAALPEHGLAERLGPSAAYLRALAAGRVQRPLQIAAPLTNYEEHMPLEHPLTLLEPLLFLLGRVLGELCSRLRSQACAARSIEICFELESHAPYCSKLEFPVPLNETQSILKLVQLHFERHPPPAPIRAFTLRIESAAARRIQSNLFLPPAPPADKLQVTLARIAGLVGEGNVGTPVLLNTHRPDAFEMRTFQPLPAEPNVHEEASPSGILRLAIRLFRPALHARVRMAAEVPQSVLAPSIRGHVVQHAGPWKTSGEWWAPTFWSREEWDVALDDGALYRLYFETNTREWYVHGVYD